MLFILHHTPQTFPQSILQYKYYPDDIFCRFFSIRKYHISSLNLYDFIFFFLLSVQYFILQIHYILFFPLYIIPMSLFLSNSFPEHADSHVGIIGNEIVDYLASERSQSYSSLLRPFHPTFINPHLIAFVYHHYTAIGDRIIFSIPIICTVFHL